MMAIVSTFRTWRTARGQSREDGEAPAPSGARGAARPEWGVVEVRRTLDTTNTGPFMGWPSQ